MNTLILLILTVIIGSCFVPNNINYCEQKIKTNCPKEHQKLS